MVRTLPKKLTELGRIRLGDREPNSNGRGTHPHKLDCFRLTSSNRSLLHFAASTYGGDVREWTGEGAPKDDHQRPTHFELYTTVNAMDVLIPTFSAISLDYEQWSASGRQRHCDGTSITACPLQEALVGTPCACPDDEQERAQQAQQGKACFRILRLNVLLPDLPGIGSWRLETKGFYATAELLGTLDMLQMAGQEHNIVEAVLRLEQRQVKRVGKGEGKGTLKFAVPVLWPKYTPRQILAGAANVLLTAPAHPPLQTEASPVELLYGGRRSPVEAQIDALLTQAGLSAQEQADRWEKWYAKYGETPDITVLAMLRDKLQDAVDQRQRAGTGQATTPSLGLAKDENQREFFTEGEGVGA